MWRLRDLWYEIYHGFRNLWRWLPIIWSDYDWDWVAIARVLEFKLLRHAELEEKHGHHTDSKLDAKRMRICANLLRRLMDDKYFENAEKRFGSGRNAGNFAFLHQRADQKYLGVLIGKYLNHWWD